jgi:hypothetical protein
MEVNGQLHGPAALPPGKEPLVPIGQESGWAPIARNVAYSKFIRTSKVIVEVIIFCSNIVFALRFYVKFRPFINYSFLWVFTLYSLDQRNVPVKAGFILIHLPP